jgi:hypothetical protein
VLKVVLVAKALLVIKAFRVDLVLKGLSVVKDPKESKVVLVLKVA